jgi:hypothetical protein
MLPVRESGGPGRRFRQREQERTGKKGTPRCGGIAGENAGTGSDSMERIGRPPGEGLMPGSPRAGG